MIIAQYCLFFAFHLPCTILLKPKINGERYIPQKPFIIAANHPSKIDPFLLCLLPFTAVRQLLPVYFLTSVHYYGRWYLRLILKLLGCYPVAKRAWTLDDYLSTSVKKVEAGKVIMFFPEGKVIKKGKNEKPRPGIGYLIEQTNKPILPLHINWETTNSSFIKRPVLTFGKPFIVDTTKSKIVYEDIAVEVMNKIYSI